LSTFTPFFLLPLLSTMPHILTLTLTPSLAFPSPSCPRLPLPVLPSPLAAAVNNDCYRRRRHLKLPLPQSTTITTKSQRMSYVIAAAGHCPSDAPAAAVLLLFYQASGTCPFC
jgi:hypothetical protein